MGVIYNFFTSGYPDIAIQCILEFIPILLIAVIALVFGILNYRTNKKILKKLEGMEHK